MDCLSRLDCLPQGISLCIHKHSPNQNTSDSKDLHNDIQLIYIFIMDDLEFLIGRSRFSSSCSVLFDLKRPKAATELWDASRSLERSRFRAVCMCELKQILAMPCSFLQPWVPSACCPLLRVTQIIHTIERRGTLRTQEPPAFFPPRQGLTM